MATASFRLARVLRLRTQLRERAQDDVAREKEALARVHAELASVRAASQAAFTAEAASAATGMTGADLQRARAYTDALAVREEALREESSRRAAEVERLRALLRLRRREERQLELLRDRVQERAEVAEERVTATLLDDLARRRKA